MTAPAPIKRQMTIADIRKHDGPIYLMNNTGFLQTCHDQVGEAKIDFELAPRGEVDSIKLVAKEAILLPGVQKAWRRGELIISIDDSFDEQVELLLNKSAVGIEEVLANVMAQGGEDGATATVQIEGSAANRALEERPCLVCGKRDTQTGVITAGRVVQSTADVKAGVAPLCPSHTHMFHEFTPRQVHDGEDQFHWEFDRVSVTPTQRESLN